MRLVFQLDSLGGNEPALLIAAGREKEEVEGGGGIMLNRLVE